MPALYQQADDYCPVTPTRLATIPAPLAEPQEPACPQGRYGFIGRDAELLRLERALRDDEAPWALLSGMAGVGKTELAHGFGRWLYETGGCPGGVFRASFREHVSLAGVLGEVMAHEADFPALAPEAQFGRAVQYLRATPCLLIWDDVEAVAGDARASAGLARLAAALQGGRSRLLLVSAPAGGLAGSGVPAPGGGRLAPGDAGTLATRVLAGVGLRPETYRDDDAYANY